MLQVETGVELALGAEPSVVALGQALIRIGLGRLEARLLPGSAVIQDGESGFPDPGIGLKVRLSDADARVRVSGLASSTLPIGSGGLSEDEVGGGAKLVVEGGLGSAASWAVNLGYSFLFSSPEDGTIAVIVTPGLSISSIEGLGIYGGWAGFFGEGVDAHFAEAGLAYAIDSDTQLDVNFGVDVGGGPSQWFVGLGLARRWR